MQVVCGQLLLCPVVAKPTPRDEPAQGGALATTNPPKEEEEEEGEDEDEDDSPACHRDS